MSTQPTPPPGYEIIPDEDLRTKPLPVGYIVSDRDPNDPLWLDGKRAGKMVTEKSIASLTYARPLPESSTEPKAAETDQAPPQEPADGGVKRCILNLDSPSLPPSLEEYLECGCASCLEVYSNLSAPTGAEQELLPCPFCGTEPISRWVGVSVPGMEDCGYHAVECPKCVGSGGVPFCGVHADLREDAEKQWNRRPAAPVAVGETPLDCEQKGAEA